jgi:hypothetical protein
MSWIDKELKKRARQSAPAAPDPATTVSPEERMQELWARVVRANEALPDLLRLHLEASSGRSQELGGPVFLAWLRAPNGAALGYAADSIRYVWPDPGRKKSNNFWIRWDVERKRFLVHRRVGTPPVIVTYRYDERRIDHIIKCLVTGKRVTVRSVKRKRLWLF